MRARARFRVRVGVGVRVRAGVGVRVKGLGVRELLLGYTTPADQMSTPVLYVVG